MEVKKAEQREVPSSSLTKQSPSKVVAVAQFIGEVKEEFQRVTWTSAEEMRTYAKIVVGMTFCCGMAIYLVDLSIQAALGIISSVFRFIAG